MPLKGFIDSKDSTNIKLTTGNAKLKHTDKNVIGDSTVNVGYNTEDYFFDIEGENSQYYEVDRQTLPRIKSKIERRPVNVRLIVPPKEYDGTCEYDISTCAFELLPTGDEESGLVENDQAYVVYNNPTADWTNTAIRGKYNKAKWLPLNGCRKVTANSYSATQSYYVNGLSHNHINIDDQYLTILRAYDHMSLHKTDASGIIHYLNAFYPDISLQSITNSVTNISNIMPGTYVNIQNVENTDVIYTVRGENLIDSSKLSLNKYSYIAEIMALPLGRYSTLYTNSGAVGRIVNSADLDSSTIFNTLNYESEALTLSKLGQLMRPTADLNAWTDNIYIKYKLSEQFTDEGSRSKNTLELMLIGSSSTASVGVMKPGVGYLMIPASNFSSLKDYKFAFKRSSGKVNLDALSFNNIPVTTDSEPATYWKKVITVPAKNSVTFLNQFDTVLSLDGPEVTSVEGRITPKNSVYYVNNNSVTSAGENVTPFKESSSSVSVSIEEDENLYKTRRANRLSDFGKVECFVNSISVNKNCVFDNLINVTADNIRLEGEAGNNYRINEYRGVTKMLPARLIAVPRVVNKVWDNTYDSNEGVTWTVKARNATMQANLDKEDIAINPEAFNVYTSFSTVGTTTVNVELLDKDHFLTGSDAYKFILDGIEPTDSVITINPRKVKINPKECIMYYRNEDDLTIEFTGEVVDYNTNEIIEGVGWIHDSGYYYFKDSGPYKLSSLATRSGIYMKSEDADRFSLKFNEAKSSGLGYIDPDTGAYVVGTTTFRPELEIYEGDVISVSLSYLISDKVSNLNYEPEFLDFKVRLVHNSVYERNEN